MYPPERTSMDEIEKTLILEEDEVPMTTTNEEGEEDENEEDADDPE